MSGLISVLILIVCVLLALIVLVQNSKGGGLSSSFASKLTLSISGNTSNVAMNSMGCPGVIFFGSTVGTPTGFNFSCVIAAYKDDWMTSLNAS